MTYLPQQHLHHSIVQQKMIWGNCWNCWTIDQEVLWTTINWTNITMIGWCGELWLADDPFWHLPSRLLWMHMLIVEAVQRQLSSCSASTIHWWVYDWVKAPLNIGTSYKFRWASCFWAIYLVQRNFAEFSEQRHRNITSACPDKSKTRRANGSWKMEDAQAEDAP